MFLGSRFVDLPTEFFYGEGGGRTGTRSNKGGALPTFTEGVTPCRYLGGDLHCKPREASRISVTGGFRQFQVGVQQRSGRTGILQNVRSRSLRAAVACFLVLRRGTFKPRTLPGGSPGLIPRSTEKHLNPTPPGTCASGVSSSSRRNVPPSPSRSW